MDKKYRTMKMRFQDNKPYILIVGSLFVVMIILFIIIDQLVMPAIVHSRDDVTVPNLVGKDKVEGEEILRDLELFSNVVSEQYSATHEPGVIINQKPKPGTQIKMGRAVQITISKGKEEVVAPYIVGITVSQARQRLSQRGLTLGDITYDYSETVAKDSIISQSIPAGNRVPYGYNIDVVVSKGTERQILMPNIVGMAYSGIEAFLMENGLVLGKVTYRYSDTYTRETIIEQIPGPNRIVEYGSAVDIVVSKESMDGGE